MCDAWPDSAKLSIYEGEKGTIEKADIDVVWNCFLVDGDEVDARAIKILSKYNEEGAVENAYNQSGNSGIDSNTTAGAVAADSTISHVSEVEDGLILLDHNQVQYSALETVDEVAKSE